MGLILVVVWRVLGVGREREWGVEKVMEQAVDWQKQQLEVEEEKGQARPKNWLRRPHQRRIPSRSFLVKNPNQEISAGKSFRRCA